MLVAFVFDSLTLIDVGALIGGVVAGVLATLVLLRFVSGRWLGDGRARAAALIHEARQETDRFKREAELAVREAEMTRRRDFEAEADRLREVSRTLQFQVEQRAELVERRIEQIECRERELEERRSELDRHRDDLTRLVDEQRAALQRVGGLSSEEAREALFVRIDQELQHEIGRRILREEQTAAEGLAERARLVLALAIQRYAAGHTVETTVNVVQIPSEEMKGRIIGREGRNIRTFEKVTGVDLIVDDTPGVVLVSSFDPIRREIARSALDKLILDGRIHPTRIEELVEEARLELEASTIRAGVEAAREANVEGLDRKLIEQLGRLQYRTSYSQNVLKHSIEVAHLTGIMAAEIGLDGTLGRRCGLLHDVGKALDHEMEGTHTALGADLARRCGEPAEVVDAARSHHDDLRINGAIYTVLVAAADAVSASRPGARRDTLEKYVRRLSDLEALVGGFPGVEQAYALQAGREIRVIADSRVVSDEGAAKLSRDLAVAIRRELHFPGEVKVTVVRETRAVEYAR